MSELANNNIVLVDNIITANAEKFVNTITQYKWDLIPDSQLLAAKNALIKSDYIMKVAVSDVEAVQDSLMKSAILGLDLTEGKRQGWLLPRKNAQGKTVIQLQVGYKGVEAIHQRMGVIDRLTVRTVYENDEFEWSGDDKEKPKHQADWFAKDRGLVKGAFAITYFPDGTLAVTVSSIHEIYEKHRAASDSYKSYLQKQVAYEKDPENNKKPFPPPWVTHEKEMIEKTMAYIASKQWPANIRNEGMASQILETLHEIDSADYSYQYTTEQKTIFYELFDAKDSLGMYLFSRRIDIEGFAALFNTFKRGTKTENKKIVRQMETEGSKILSEIMEGFAEDDGMRVLENIEDCQEITKKLLRASLEVAEKEKYDSYIKGNVKKVENDNE